VVKQGALSGLKKMLGVGSLTEKPFPTIVIDTMPSLFGAGGAMTSITDGAS
jgi:hypothetical protein